MAPTSTTIHVSTSSPMINSPTSLSPSNSSKESHIISQSEAQSTFPFQRPVSPLATSAPGDRSRNTSASTPPPSPPLSAASGETHQSSDKREREGDDKSSSPEFDYNPYHYRRRREQHSPSHPTTKAAAAAAAAIYTSQELAVAYSMVTSNTQAQKASSQESPDKEKAEQNPTRVSHPPNSINRYPFGIPPVSNKLIAPKPSADGSDALSSLWKKSVPIQEPYFRTKHSIASQHTLSTLGGVLFSLDDEPKEFTDDMYIAMRNRIFELEAKTVDYTPFNRARKRSIDRYEYPPHGDRGYGYDHGYGHGIEGDSIHHSKRPAYSRPPHYPYHPRHSPPEGSFIHRPTHSYPAWYTPETYMTDAHPQHHRGGHGRHPAMVDRERERDQPMNGSRPSAHPSHPEHDKQSKSPPSNRPPGNAHPPPGQRPPPIQPRPTQSPPSHPSLPYTQSAHADKQTSQTSAANPNGFTPNQQQQQQSQSHKQSQHRAQQRAQSDYSRSYHLQKHMRMLDQQRLAQQQQQQQQQSVKIQRHYQPHQQMYPAHGLNKSAANLSNSPPLQQQQQQSQQQQQQQQQQQWGSRSNSLQQQYQQQQQMVQQQLIQRYQQHRQLQIKQQQVRQLQLLRQQAASQSTGENGSAIALGDDLGEKPNPKKSVISQECHNCMALDALVPWQSRAGSQESSSIPNDSTASSVCVGSKKFICAACLQFHQSHGKNRPVPSFRVNYLKKIHCQFKKALQDVRFQGWQDAQVIEIDDTISEKDFSTVFYAGIEEGMAISETRANSRSRQTSACSTAHSSPLLAPNGSISSSSGIIGSSSSSGGGGGTDQIVIKIEDDDNDDAASSPLSSGLKLTKETKTFSSEASVGELFGHRWKREPMVGYTLVHFGGSDRTRMVPMNPTVPSLTVTFDQENNLVTFAFRVLVNGLCLLSSGGGPPALHMPEMADDEDSEAEEIEEEEEEPSSSSSSSSDAADNNHNNNNNNNNNNKSNSPQESSSLSDTDNTNQSDSKTPETREQEQSICSGTSMNVDNS
ncbi:hypothetical protein BGZ76_010592, partial [Entomortierella beljakovae]